MPVSELILRKANAFGRTYAQVESSQFPYGMQLPGQDINNAFAAVQTAPT
jgi:hypothetical protein